MTRFIGVRSASVSARRPVAAQMRNRASVIHGLEAQLEASCKGFTQCRYDDALGRVVDKREHHSIDKEHFSIAGHAAVAAVIWDALKRARFVPA